LLRRQFYSRSLFELKKRGGRLPVLEDETHELLQLSKKVSNLGYLELIEGGWKTDQGRVKSLQR